MCCFAIQSHSDGKCRSTLDVLATSPDDYLDFGLDWKVKDTSHGLKTNFECWYKRLYSLYTLTWYSPNLLVTGAEWSPLIVMMTCLRVKVSDWSCSKYRTKLNLSQLVEFCRESRRQGRWCSAGTWAPRLLAWWFTSWSLWPLVGSLSRIGWAGRVAVLLWINPCWTWTIHQMWVHQYFSKSWSHLEMLINSWHFECCCWGLNSREHGALSVHPSVVYWCRCYQTWHCNFVTL